MGFKPNSRKLSFRLDTGQTKNGKPVYSTHSISRIKHDALNDSVVSLATSLKGLFSLDVVRMTTTKIDIVETD